MSGPKDPRQEEIDLPEEQRPLFRLVRDFVSKEELRDADRKALELHKAAQAAVTETKLFRGHEAILAAVDSNNKQLRGEMQRGDAKLQLQVDEVRVTAETAGRVAEENRQALGKMATRVDTLETAKTSEERRNEFIRAMSPRSMPPWDLGKKSDTGNYRVISEVELAASRLEWGDKMDAQLDKSLLAKDGARYNAILKWLWGAAGALLVAKLVADFVTHHG